MNQQQDQQNIQNQGGTGSAENTGQNREAQQHRMHELSDKEKNDIGNEIESGSVPVTSLRDMGTLSGRDDAAGGSGDEMEGTSTGDPTDRF